MNTLSLEAETGEEKSLQEKKATEFEGLIAAKAMNNEDKYVEEDYVYKLYVRYMQRALKEILEKNTYISPETVVKYLSKEFKDTYDIKGYGTTYLNYRKIMLRLGSITEKYNTVDGQIQWLEDNNYIIHLGTFYSILPRKIKTRMTNWKVLHVSLKKAKKMRNQLNDIGPEYNIADGQIQWLKDNNYTKIELGLFYKILTNATKEKMSNWTYIDISLEKAKKMRNQLNDIGPEYNTADGQIQWLKDNNYSKIHLGHFYNIIPSDIKARMTNWTYMDVSLKIAVTIRKKMILLSKSYHTLDGHIRWLEDNNYSYIGVGLFAKILSDKTKNDLKAWWFIDHSSNSNIKGEKITEFSFSYI